MPRRETSRQPRIARIEQVEERIVLSATPWPALAHHEYLPVVTHDFEVAHELDAAGDSDDLANINIGQHLSGAHAATGVDTVRSDYGFDGTGQTVVVIDSGIAYDHYSLGGGFGPSHRVVGGWDFAENDGDPFDDAPAGYHGTHVAGIIGSDHATHTGVAPGVDLVALRVFDDSGNGTFQWVDEALQWVIDNQDSFANPITTVNLSLGVPGANYSDAPAWAATLDAKFQTLNEAGIFVAVSAGNDFELFNSKGLSYPAVSDWVVPVSSANDAGTAMSDFSQRDDHVLVAPGESITSTVPDELFSFDGTPNDWASASGTSMASPYVAGASVLVREAYAFMGTAGVDQDMIYDALFDTANLIYDPITGGNYHFIDVDAALDSIITDTLADTSGAATDMGVMGDGYQFSELIGKLSDQDYFSFTAEASGTISFTATGMSAQWDLIGGGGTIDGNTLSFDVVGGQTYTVGLMSSGGMSHYDVDVQLEENVVDWGIIERSQFSGVTVAGEQWYSITTTRAGLATIEASNVGGTSVTLEFYASDGQTLIDSDISSSGYNRVDANVLAGDTLLVRVVGNCDVDFNAWNIVGVTGTHVDVFGTNGDDTLSFTAGATHDVSVNGLAYSFNTTEAATVTFHGGDGNDTYTANGSTGDDVATASAGTARVIGNGYDVTARHVEQVQFNGGGGYDSVRMWDTAGDENLVADPTSVQFTGTGFQYAASGFDKVQVYANNGGNDTAVLNGSSGDDFFLARDTYAYFSGSGFYNFVKGFDVVQADASAGGYDRARFYDSSGGDSLTISPTNAQLTGASFDNSASDFDQVKVYGVNGGNDVAVMTDSAGNDTFITTPTYSVLKGTGFYNHVSGFDQVTGQATAGGTDTAAVYDSAGNETLTAFPTDVTIVGTGFQNQAQNFDTVRAYATAGGFDQAIFYDSVNDDQFIGTHYYAVMKGTGYYNFARSFDYTEGHSTAGGNDQAKLYDGTSDDVLTVTNTYMSLAGTGFDNRAVGFALAKGFAQRGGDDTANFQNATTGDVLKATGSYADMQRAAAREYAFDFENVNAYAEATESPTLDLQPVDYVFNSYGTWL